MLVKKGQWPVIITHTVALLIFLVIFISHENYEFLGYVGVILFFMFLVLYTNHRVDYPNELLWGLTIWSILHMSGGGLSIGGTRLYDLMLWPIVGAPYYILKYDQVVHAFGFAVATLLMYILIKPLLKEDLKKWAALSIVIVMAGLGAGALNEIIEFMMTVLTPSTGVGGYENTALDLVSNFVGAIVAMVFIVAREKNSMKSAVETEAKRKIKRASSRS